MPSGTIGATFSGQPLLFAAPNSIILDSRPQHLGHILFSTWQACSMSTIVSTVRDAGISAAGFRGRFGGIQVIVAPKYERTSYLTAEPCSFALIGPSLIDHRSRLATCLVKGRSIKGVSRTALQCTGPTVPESQKYLVVPLEVGHHFVTNPWIRMGRVETPIPKKIVGGRTDARNPAM